MAATGRVRVLAVIASFLVAGCGSTASASPTGVASASPAASVAASTGASGGANSTVISSSSGGMVRLPDGATLLVPAGATNGETQAKISTDAIPADPPSAAWPDRAVGLAYRIDLGGALLAKPVTVTLPFDAATLPSGVTPDELVLAYHDEAAGRWIPVASTVDLGSRTVTAQVSHLSDWALWAPDWDYWLALLKSAASGNLTTLLHAVATFASGCSTTAGAYTIDNASANKMIEGCLTSSTPAAATMEIRNLRAFALEVSDPRGYLASPPVLLMPGDAVAITVAATDASPVLVQANMSRLGFTASLVDIALGLLPNIGASRAAPTWRAAFTEIVTQIDQLHALTDAITQAEAGHLPQAAEAAVKAISGLDFLTALARAAHAAGVQYGLPALANVGVVGLQKAMLVVGLGDLIVTTWSFFGDWFFNVHTEVRLTWPATTYRAWTSVGALSTARGAATATLLNDGKVLVVGGEPYGDGIGPPPPAPAELFDPTTGEWTTTASPRLVSGWGLTATLLTDGRVLVVGGYADRRVYTEPIDAPAGAAEIYDPVSQKWTRAHDAPDARAGQTATRLLDGRVLLAGGGIGAGCTFTAEVYDPALDQWQATEDMKDCRSGHTATLLRDGRVFVAGGFAGGFEYQSGVATSETYDPRTGHWTAAAAMATNREGATATRLRDGRVLVVGGATYPTRSPCGPDSAGGCVVVPSAVASAELYDPASNSWQAVPPMHTARSYHGAVLLPDGRVLVIGGRGAHRVLLASAEIYDPTTKAWAAAPALHAARFDFEAVLLADGRVLASGGGDTQAELRGTEVLGPPPSGR